jgi:hypothetical protein
VGFALDLRMAGLRQVPRKAALVAAISQDPKLSLRAQAPPSDDHEPPQGHVVDGSERRRCLWTGLEVYHGCSLRLGCAEVGEGPSLRYHSAGPGCGAAWGMVSDHDRIPSRQQLGLDAAPAMDVSV